MQVVPAPPMQRSDPTHAQNLKGQYAFPAKRLLLIVQGNAFLFTRYISMRE